MAYNGLDLGDQHKHLDEDTFEVVLEEGDILYHPAGIWHQVSCLTDDSISINFSIRQVRIADLVTNAQRMMMLSVKEMRQGVRLDLMNDMKKYQDI